MGNNDARRVAATPRIKSSGCKFSCKWEKKHHVQIIDCETIHVICCLPGWTSALFHNLTRLHPHHSTPPYVTFDAVQTSLRVSEDNRFHIILDANGFENIDKKNTALFFAVQRPYPIEKSQWLCFYGLLSAPICHVLFHVMCRSAYGVGVVTAL